MKSNKSALARSSASILSPLRYPGSKRRLAGYIKQSLMLNDLHPELFVEPFAGGSSVSLQLLNDNLVEQIGLIEIDPLVAAFWKTVFFDADWLVQQVQTIDITLEKWYEFKVEIPKELRSRALTCLFLNRTSFSGILAPKVGPIGGKKQKSQYKIDCRFPRDTLVKRIRQAEALKDRVAFVWNLSWCNGISLIRKMQQHGTLPKKNIFFYFDPPFFEKADRLYTHYFNYAKHRKLRDAIVQLNDPWILSYDSAKQIEELYGVTEGDTIQVEMLYSTSSTAGHRIAQEVILSNLSRLPSETRLWNKNDECKKNKKSENGKVRGNLAQKIELCDSLENFKEISDYQLILTRE